VDSTTDTRRLCPGAKPIKGQPEEELVGIVGSPLERGCKEPESNGTQSRISPESCGNGIFPAIVLAVAAAAAAADAVDSCYS